MAFDPAFLDELRARTPIAAVIGRKVKLVRSGRQHKACCPFHGEKTPSFYVYEDGFHCFGCGAHGDAISFVMQSEGRSFLEAVEALASEAGMEVPKQAPVDRQRAEKQKTLADVLEATQRSWVRRLFRPEGAAGLAYLRGRGLSDETIAAHGLGWSGDGRGGLVAELREQGFEAPMLAEAGLMRLDEDGRPKGELFFNRVTFPIRDRRGALVSFGGRILGDGQPKYLNGPETALFSKRRTLFGLDRAQKALRTVRPESATPQATRTLLVVEGYMDVIALDQAGFGAAVAPLGTALTAEQMEALWRVDPAPVLCFDGDAAGGRAAVKAATTALPLLNLENTVRFMSLPSGEDPDSFVRKRGQAAMAQAIKGARRLDEVLFGFLSEGVSTDRPEQRAALHRKLLDTAELIADVQLKAQYRRILLGQFFEAFSDRSRPKETGGKPVGGGRRAAFVRPDIPAFNPDRERQRVLLALLIQHPGSLGDVEQALCNLRLPPDLAMVRSAILAAVHDEAIAEPAALLAHLQAAGLTNYLEQIFAPEPLPVPTETDPSAMPADVEKVWWHLYEFLNLPGLNEEIARAQAKAAESGDEADFRRLLALLRSRELIQSGGGEDEG